MKRLLGGDRGWTAGVGLASALVFLTTFGGRVAAGDAPESVAGIRSLGILHAPGYPAYVIAGRLFLLIVPFGSASARVNLFSLVCAALAVVGVFVVARRLGAPRPAAAIGAMAVATGTSFWFYAGFAKHYAFSALVLVTAFALVLAWADAGGSWRLATAGALVGAGAGASWQLAALAIPALGGLVLFGGRRRRLVELALPAAAGAVVVLALGAFLVVRAGARPPVNWGNATSVSRVADLVTMKDFGFGPTTINRAPGAAGKSVGGRQVVALPRRIRAYTVVVTREFSYLALLVAVYGAVASFSLFGRARAIALLVHIGVNLVSAALVVGFRNVRGFSTGLAQGGFLIGVFLVIGIWLAAAVSDGMARVGRRRGRTKAERKRIDATRARDQAIVAGVAAAILLLPSLVIHRRPANHRQPPLVDAYARDVFAALPRGAVIFCWGAERAFPLIYRQVVSHDRGDVTVVVADQVQLPWYREELAAKLGRKVEVAPDDTPRQAAARLSNQLRGSRPVFIDASSMPNLIHELRYRPAGIVGEVLDGTGVEAPASMTALEKRIASYSSRAVYRSPQWNRFPNELVFQAYEIAELELATALYREHDLAGAEQHLESAVRLNPRDKGTRQTLDKVKAERLQAR